MKNALNGISVLVTGACGMLAFDLIPELLARGGQVYASDVRDNFNLNLVEPVHFSRVDLCDPVAVLQLVENVRPTVVINCAAYTAVDKAEEDYNTALNVNARAVLYLARACKVVDAKLVHISTDYVFGACNVKSPISEDLPPAPCGVYGWSKYLGELFVGEVLGKGSLIVRTSWLHGPGGPNFLETMLSLGNRQSTIKVVNDQIGSPTYTAWLAQVLAVLVAQNIGGVIHVSSRAGISWYDFAKEIFECAGKKVDLQTQTTAELNRPAPRPAYSVFSLGRLESEVGYSAQDWKVGVRDHLSRLK